MPTLAESIAMALNVPAVLVAALGIAFAARVVDDWRLTDESNFLWTSVFVAAQWYLIGSAFDAQASRSISWTKPYRVATGFLALGAATGVVLFTQSLLGRAALPIDRPQVGAFFVGLLGWLLWTIYAMTRLVIWR